MSQTFPNWRHRSVDDQIPLHFQAPKSDGGIARAGQQETLLTRKWQGMNRSGMALKKWVKKRKMPEKLAKSVTLFCLHCSSNISSLNSSMSVSNWSNSLASFSIFRFSVANAFSFNLLIFKILKNPNLNAWVPIAQRHHGGIVGNGGRTESTIAVGVQGGVQADRGRVFVWDSVLKKLAEIW